MSMKEYEEAIVHLNAKRYERALDLLLELQPDSDSYPMLSYYIGLCYTHLEKYDEALLFLEQVASSDLGLMHLFQCRMILGYIYAITNRNRLAEFEFRKVLEDGFESAKVYSALAHALYNQKKADESIESLEKALNLEPENANALNSLGFILADQEKRLSMALVFCQRAVARNPENPAYLDSLGWAHFKNGNSRDARACLRKALDLAPRNKEIGRHLKLVIEKAKGEER